MSARHRTTTQPLLTGMQVRILFALALIAALAVSPLLPSFGAA